MYTVELNNDFMLERYPPYTHISCSVHTEHFENGKNFVPYVRYILDQYQKLNFLIPSPYTHILCTVNTVHFIFYCKNVLYLQYIFNNINVNIKMYIFDHLRMYIFAILPLDRYIFLSDKIFP